MAAQWDITQAPLDEKKLESIGPLLRVLGGTALIAYSGASTVVILGGLLSVVISSSVAGIGVAYIIAGVLAFLVTVGQWATRRKMPKTHWFLVLACDAPFTTWQTNTWLTTIVQAQSSLTTEGKAIIWLVSIVWGIFCAKVGEAALIRKTGG